MSSKTPPSKVVPVCRWCELVPSEILFDDALLCAPCHEKALLALNDPKLRGQYRAAIDYSAPLYKWIPTCKWCSTATSQTEFEGIRVCFDCEKKGIHAAANPKLCDRCSELFAEPRIIEDLFREDGFRHLSAYDLRKRSEEGCEMCRMIWLHDPNEDEARLHANMLTLFAEQVEGAEKLTGEFVSAGDVNSLYFESEVGQMRMTMSVFALPDDPASKFVSQRPQEDLGSENTNNLIRGWLDECLETHAESLDAELPLLPTRVVDVGTLSNPEIKLYETPPDFRARYITLSYCWGRPRFLVTLMANLEEHKKGLDFATLPLTFQDAIITTRNLGFRYVWIDALCIIQDSVEDKIKEIGNMGDVYNDSALTIAVVCPTAVSEGFLKSKVAKPVKLPYRCPDGTTGSVSVIQRKESDLWDESLYTRAWCLQENLLSPRLLLYTDTEVIWQCQSSPMKRPNNNYVSYAGEDPNIGKSPFSRLPGNILRPNPEISGPNLQKFPSDVARYDIWRFLVGNYTKRNLTVASDRLPALSGIVQKFEVAWKDRYLAGIWERQLLPSLAWRRSQDMSQSYYPALSEYRAPSWSWASIDGPVVFDTRFDLGNMRGSQAKIISCEFDINSKVRDAIVIEGYMIPAAQMVDAEEDRMGSLILDNHPDNGRFPKYADRLVGFNEEMKGLCWRFLLGEGKEGSGKMTRTTALVLMQVGEKDENTFQRIGFWSTSVKGSAKLWIGQGSNVNGNVRNNKRVIRII